MEVEAEEQELGQREALAYWQGWSARRNNQEQNSSRGGSTGGSGTHVSICSALDK